MEKVDQNSFTRALKAITAQIEYTVLRVHKMYFQAAKWLKQNPWAFRVMFLSFEQQELAWEQIKEWRRLTQDTGGEG